jgi:hypothetical protein
MANFVFVNVAKSLDAQQMELSPVSIRHSTRSVVADSIRAFDSSVGDFVFSLFGQLAAIATLL